MRLTIEKVYSPCYPIGSVKAIAYRSLWNFQRTVRSMGARLGPVSAV